MAERCLKRRVIDSWAEDSKKRRKDDAPEQPSSTVGGDAKPSSPNVDMRPVMYVIGGEHANNPEQTFERYDFLDETWSEPETLNFKRCCAAVTTFQNEIWVIGGVKSESTCLALTSRESWVYNTYDKEWRESLQDLTTPRSDHCAAVAAGKLYVVGGCYENKYYNNAEVYDSNSGWKILEAKMAEKRREFGLAVFEDEILIAAGGNNVDQWNNLRTLQSLEQYSSRTNEWRSLCIPFPWERSELKLIVDGQRLFVLGGNLGSSVVYSTLYRDPINRNILHNHDWTHVLDVRLSQSMINVAVHAKKVYIVGGLKELSDDEILDTVSIFDLDLMTLVALPSSMAKTRRSAGVAIVQEIPSWPARLRESGTSARRARVTKR